MFVEIFLSAVVKVLRMEQLFSTNDVSGALVLSIFLFFLQLMLVKNIYQLENLMKCNTFVII